jgi:hypothetical protein
MMILRWCRLLLGPDWFETWSDWFGLGREYWHSDRLDYLR